MICADAVVISALPYSDTLDTSGLPTDGSVSPLCGGDADHAAWYVYTPPVGVTALLISTADTDYDTVLSAYTGACAALTEVACDDDGGPGATSQIALSVTPGTPYHFLVSGWGDGGTLAFAVTDLTPDSAPVPIGALGFGRGYAVEFFCSAETGALIATWPTPDAFITGAFDIVAPVAVVLGDATGRWVAVGSSGTDAIVAGDLTTETALDSVVSGGLRGIPLASAAYFYRFRTEFVPVGGGVADSYRPVFERYSLSGSFVTSWTPPDYYTANSGTTPAIAHDFQLGSAGVAPDDSVMYFTGSDRGLGSSDDPAAFRRLRRYSLESGEDLSDLATDDTLVPVVKAVLATGDVITAWVESGSQDIVEMRRYHADGTLAHTSTTFAGRPYYAIGVALGIEAGTYWLADLAPLTASLVDATDTVVLTISLPAAFENEFDLPWPYYATRVALGALTITCGDDQVAASALGFPVAVTWDAPETSGGTGAITVVCVPASGSLFPLGETTVTCTATDEDDVTATCTFTVTIYRTLAITCVSRAVDSPTNDPVIVTWPTPATVGGIGAVTTVCVPASGSSFAVGLTDVTCTATDSLGHTATCLGHVTVNGQCDASDAFEFDDPCAIVTPLYYATVTVGADVYAHSLGIPIDDRTGWHLGYKEPRLLSIGSITKAASDVLTGHFEGQAVTLTYADADRIMRTIPREAHDQPRSTLTNCPVMIYQVGGRNETPRPLFSGEIYNTPVSAHLQFQIVVNDLLGSRGSLFGSDQHVPARTVGAGFPSAPVRSRDLAVPIVYGEVSDEGALTPAGEVIAIDIGDLVVNGNARRGALICGHGVKSILNVYQDGTLIAGGDADATWPGKADWTTINGSADHYTEIGDAWYALVLLTGTRATDFVAGKAITVNLQGIATGADGSGDLITDLLLQYRHLLLNWILTPFTSETWAVSPTFAVYPDGTPLCRVRTQSFQTASETAATFVDGGLVGGFVLGAEGRSQSVRDVIAAANFNCNVRLASNDFGQLFVRMLPRVRTVALAGHTTVEDVTDILDTPAFQSDQKIEWLATELSYRHTYNYRNRQWDGGNAIGNAPAELVIGRPIVKKFEFTWIRDVATADAVAQQYLDLLSETNEIVQWARPVCGLEHELLDVVPLHHFSGRAVDQTVWILRKTIDPMTDIVSFEGISIGHLLS